MSSAMRTFDTDELGSFSEDGLRKVALLETDDMFVDWYGLLPGQAQDVHVHDAADKCYLVLEGEGTFAVGAEERTLGPGALVVAERGEPHGVRNGGEDPLRLLVWMAPVPSGDGGHDHHHVERRPRRLAAFTVSSSRSAGDDPSGAAIRELAEEAGHEVADSAVVPDAIDPIRSAVEGAVDGVDAVVLTGGTGITPDDVTVEALRPLFAKELDGFGEHLRRLSVDEIGSAVIMTRATAGIVERTPVFALPGSTAAVELAMREVVLPELDHVVDLARR